VTLVRFSLIFSTGRGGCIEMPSDGYASTDRSMEWVHGRCIIFIRYLLFFLSPPFAYTYGGLSSHFLFFFFYLSSSWTLFRVWSFFPLQIPTLHSFEKPQLEDIRHTYFFLVFLFLLTMPGFVKRKRYPFTSYDPIEDSMPRLVFSFFSFFFFLIVGRIVDGFAFLCFFCNWEGRREGREDGWMDRWMEGSIIPYHIRVLLLDWIELNWYHILLRLFSSMREWP